MTPSGTDYCCLVNLVFGYSNIDVEGYEAMDRAVFRRQAEICQALANAKRLELLHAMRDGEMTVADLQRATELPQTTVSQHLARLRAAGIVRRRQQGTNVFYTLADPRIAEACDIIHAVLASHLAGESELAERVSNGAPAATYGGGALG